MVLSASASLALCFVTSALAGIGAGFFGCLLSSADKQKRENGGKATRQSKLLMTVGVIGSTLFGFASIAGLYFGPVTLVTIIRAGSTLPANAIFSQVFRIRPLIKDDYVGTVACVCGVVCFVCYQGPPAKPPVAEQFWEDFITPWAIAWNSALFLLLILAAVFLTVFDQIEERLFSSCKFIGSVGKVVSVALIIACASSFMDVAIKGWSAALHHNKEHKDDPNFPDATLFWIAFVTNVGFLVIMRLGTIYGCAKCDVLLFVPLNQVLNVFLSVATGMVVLDEGRDIYSWVGLVFSMLSVFGGIIMLVHGPAEDESSDATGVADGGTKAERAQTAELVSAGEVVAGDSVPALSMGSNGQVWRIRRAHTAFPWSSEVVQSAHKADVKSMPDVEDCRGEDTDDSSTEESEGESGEISTAVNQFIGAAPTLNLFILNHRHQFVAEKRKLTHSSTCPSFVPQDGSHRSLDGQIEGEIREVEEECDLAGQPQDVTVTAPLQQYQQQPAVTTVREVRRVDAAAGNSGHQPQ